MLLSNIIKRVPKSSVDRYLISSYFTWFLEKRWKWWINVPRKHEDGVCNLGFPLSRPYALWQPNSFILEVCDCTNDGNCILDFTFANKTKLHISCISYFILLFQQCSTCGCWLWYWWYIPHGIFQIYTNKHLILPDCKMLTVRRNKFLCKI